MYTGRFGGGPWDGQRRERSGEPEAEVEVPTEDGGPFTYVLKNVTENWQPGGTLAIYEPHEKHDPGAQ
jgi:hypothetical protein